MPDTDRIQTVNTAQVTDNKDKLKYDFGGHMASSNSVFATQALGSRVLT